MILGAKGGRGRSKKMETPIYYMDIRKTYKSMDMLTEYLIILYITCIKADVMR